MTTVRKWSGRETRALREAKRMSVREFAAHLGVSDRTVSKWEAGGPDVYPRPDTQAILDTALERSSSEVKARFDLLFSPDAAAGASSAGGDPPVLEDEGSRDHSVRQIRHPVDGKLMTLIDAGVFLGGPDEQPVWLPAFYADVTPVTNRDYANFVAATDHRAPSHWPDGRWPEELRNHPVVNVTFRDAEAYAAWVQKSPPTAEEWEKTTRGNQGNVYPWGSQPTTAKCNVRESGVGRTTPVDRYHSGISPYGVYDMSGNVWEWCRTETEPGRFVLKGSAFTSPFSLAVASAINDASAEMMDDDTGFRCVCPTTALVAPASNPRPS